MQLSTTTWKADGARAHAVCLHGITGSSASWWRVADHLVTRGFTVTAPDLRGHGHSRRPASGYALDELIDDVVGTVGPDIDLLIGHSFGGTLALRGVSTGAISAPVTVLEDPVIRLDPDQARSVAEAEINWRPPDVTSINLEQPTWLPQDIAGRILAHYQMDPDAVQLAWTSNAPWDLTSSLDTAATLTKLRAVVPTASPYIGPQLLKRLVSTLGSPAVLQVACGHSVHREEFGMFIDAIGTWYFDPQRNEIGSRPRA